MANAKAMRQDVPRCLRTGEMDRVARAKGAGRGRGRFFSGKMTASIDRLKITNQ